MEEVHVGTEMGGSGVPDVLVQMPTRPVVTQQLVHVDLQDERIMDVVDRVQRTIRAAYPTAEFVSYIGTNPLGVYIDVYTDGNDFDGILQVLSEKLGNLYIAAGINVCVVPRKKAQAAAA